MSEQFFFQTIEFISMQFKCQNSSISNNTGKYKDTA